MQSLVILMAGSITGICMYVKHYYISVSCIISWFKCTINVQGKLCPVGTSGLCSWASDFCHLLAQCQVMFIFMWKILGNCINVSAVNPLTPVLAEMGHDEHWPCFNFDIIKVNWHHLYSCSARGKDL